MAFEIPNTEPHKLIAGNSWQWDKTLAQFPASAGWQLSYKFRGETDYDAVWGAEVTSPTGEDGYETRIVPANSGLTPGPYVLWGEVTDGTDVFTPIELKLNILPDPKTAVNAKSFNQTQLDAIETSIATGVLTAAQKSITINGRGIQTLEPKELEGWRGYYKYLVELEKNPSARLSHAAVMRRPR